MKSKNKERVQAIEMRKEGVSVLKISERLKVSQSSVSIWTRGVLTAEETRKKSIDRIKEFGHIGIKNAQKKHFDRRDKAFEDGCNKAKEGRLLHSWGCMLYWAEGSKSNGTFAFCNTDVEMILLFKRFLLQELEVSPDQMIVEVKFHDKSFDSENLEKNTIEDFWKEKLGEVKRLTVLPMAITENGSKKKNRHRYGLCRILVHNKALLYHVLGAIEEYKLIGLK